MMTLGRVFKAKRSNNMDLSTILLRSHRNTLFTRLKNEPALVIETVCPFSLLVA